MNVLFLTNDKADNKEELIDFIRLYGDNVILYHDRIDNDFVKKNKIDFIVSDRYSYMVPKDVLEYVKGNAINTHPSLLPLNRGVQPNFFSIFLNTRKGVTIHYMDKGLDTGNIIAQQELFFNDDDTLKTSHYICRKTIVNLFCSNWYNILHNNIRSTPQQKKGNMNYQKDFDRIFSEFRKGWDTTIREIDLHRKN